MPDCKLKSMTGWPQSKAVVTAIIKILCSCFSKNDQMIKCQYFSMPLIREDSGTG